MAVFTKVSRVQLDHFLSSYDLGTVRQFAEIPQGTENSNYFLQTDIGKYVLTLYEKRVDAKDIGFFLQFLLHLNECGIICPLPVKTRDGALSGGLCAKTASISLFLPGKSTQNPTIAQCHELGKGLARLHQAGKSFRQSRENNFSARDWRPLYEKIAARIAEIKTGLNPVLEAEIVWLEKHWPKDLERGLIHADLFPDNVFFLNQKLSGFIDFYFACNDLLLYDVAITLSAWCFDSGGQFCPARARALVGAYHHAFKMPARQWRFLPVLARGACLRFFLTRAYDWLFPDQTALVTLKDPLEYLDKLAFHKGIRHWRDYGIEAAL